MTDKIIAATLAGGAEFPNHILSCEVNGTLDEVAASRGITLFLSHISERRLRLLAK